ncbi:PHRF1 family protein [Megaselia abdita]
MKMPRSRRPRKTKTKRFKIWIDEEEDEDSLSTSSSGEGDGNGSSGDESFCNSSSDSEYEVKPSQRQRWNPKRVVDDYGSDSSSSGSEINTRIRRSRLSRNPISEDEARNQPSTSKAALAPAQPNEADTASDTSSGSNELLEKCPICLLSFRQQEVGRPEKCDHKFCAQCIHEWSKNVQTCPIDRIEFESIIVFKSYEDQTFTRKIQVDKTAATTSATVEEDSTQCQICERADREEVMLLCDRCDQGYHMDCLSPPLTAIPAGSWFCDNCFSDEEDDPSENIHSLYDGLREMGIPESSLTPASLNAPRVLRTRLNERIQAEIFNQRRYNLRTSATTEIDITRPSTSREIQMRSVSSVRIARVSSENIMRLRRRTMSIMRRTKKRTKRRRKKPKTKNIVVEYDLENGQDKKFASKTKKVTIRRRKTRRTSKKSKRSTATRRTAKRRTAKSSCKTVIRVSSTSHEQGSSAPSIVGSHSFSLFGGRNDLEYFDEDDSFENIPTEIEIATSSVGGGIASSIRVSNYTTRSNLLRGKSSLITPSMQSSSVDVLSDILEMQDRWQNASLDKVEIGKDGKLNLNKASPTKPDRTPENQDQDVQTTEAPMYPRGGGSSFNRGSGNNFRFERGGSRGNYSRHSTGNSSYSNTADGGGSTSNFNNNSSGFNNNNNNNSGGGNFNSSFSGFGNIRFNRSNRGGGRNNRNNAFRQRQTPPQGFQGSNSTEQQSQAPPSLLNLSFPPDITSLDQSQEQPEPVPLLSVPPPPIPPPSFSAPPPLLNSSLQNLSAYGNDEDEAPDEENHCPNESIYSAETIKIFSQGENSGDMSQLASASTNDEPAKPSDDIDCDEDLVQYDDDEEIPNVIGPQPCPPEVYTPNGSDSDEIPLPPQDEEESPIKMPFIGPMNYTDLLDNIDLPQGDPSEELDDIGLPEGEPKTPASENDAEVQELTKDDEQTEDKLQKDEDIDKEGESKELDRSYTPCLDEKSEVEDDGRAQTPKVPIEKLKDDDQPHNTLEIETELISDDDSLNSMNNKENERGENSRHGKERENRQNFKKVKNQRGRNYRSDNLITTGRRRTRSRSRSRSRSSDYRRRRDRRRSRSRSRSNDRYNSRNGRQNKVKRQDIPRYDVRNVINSRPQIDRFGRHTNRKNSKSRSRSRSFSRSRKRRNSRSSSRRNFRRSVSVSPRRRLSRSPRRLNGGVGKRYSVSPYKNRRSHSISRSLSYSPSRNRRSLSKRSKSPSKHRPVKRKRSKEPKKKKRDKNVKKRTQSNTVEQPWSPSPSPELTPPHNSNMMSWTPVTQTPPLPKGGISKRKVPIKDKKDKKKVKKTDKKEKKNRKKRSEKSTSSPPSKEVFASGNNILVSVSFGNNQSAEQQQQQQPLAQKQQQTTIVTVPPTREEVVSGLLGKRDKKKTKKDKQSAEVSSKDNADVEQRKSRKKIDAKPVAIIDLERSPFQITQSNSDVIILTDSDGAVDDHAEHEKNTSSIDKDISTQDQGPQKEHVDIFNNDDEDDEESQNTTTYGQALLQMGPKTPPEPTVENSLPNVKFSIGGKKAAVNSRNPLHEEDDQSTASSQPSRRTEKSNNLQQFPSATSPPSQLLPEPSSIENISKIGPNTPPDSAPCSPDVYDPFEPTKSPSGSEGDDDRDKSMNSIDHEMDSKNTSLPLNTSTDVDEDRPPTSLDLGLSTSAPSSIPGLQILTNVMISSVGRVNGAGSNKSAAGANSSGASAGVAALNVSVNELLNNSPYSPGSDDYEDLFEPPVDRNKNRQPTSSKKPGDTFDNLFGSSSPPATHIKSKSQVKHHSHSKRHHKASRRNADDVPGSATELMAKDKLIKKLNRHERVVEEVKIVLKPHYMKKHISREDYKEIMKRSIPKIMHSRSGEINPTKIQNLIEAYVKKFRQKNKLNLLTTQGQVSSAVKCAAYLKKL